MCSPRSPPWRHRAADSPAGFLLGNEYAWTGSIQGRYEYARFDDDTIRAYHDWIRRRFSDVTTWNRLTGRRDAAVDDVRPPPALVQGNDGWEWWLFNRQAFADFLRSGRDGIRSVDGTTPVSYALLCGNRWDAATEDAALAFLDVQGDNLYWGWDKDWAGYGTRLSRRIGAGHPLLVTETGFATYEPAPRMAAVEAGEKPEGELVEPGRAARLMTQNLWFLAPHPEVCGVFPYSFNDEWWIGGDRARIDAVGDCFGLVTADRESVKQVGRAVGGCYAEFEKVDSFLAARRASVDVLVTDQAVDWRRSQAPQPNVTDVTREPYTRGVGFHLVSLLNPQDLESSPCRRLLMIDSVIPDNPDKTSPAFDALRRFKARGGEILILTEHPLSGIYGSGYSAEDLGARVVPSTNAVWREIESFVPARRTTLTSDRNVFWRVFSADGVAHLLLMVDVDQPATTIEIEGFRADTMIAGDAGSYRTTVSGCVLTNVKTRAHNPLSHP